MPVSRSEATTDLRKIARALLVTSLFVIAGIFPSALWSSPADSISTVKEIITLQGYIAELHTAMAALKAENPAAAHSLHASLPGEWVVLMDEQSIRVKTGWLSVALLAREKAPAENAVLLENARQRLAGMVEDAEALSAPQAGAELAQSKAKVETILSDREFQGSHELSWLDKQKARIRLWISRHLDKLFARMGVSASVGETFAWILVSLVGLLLAFWGVRSMLTAAARSKLDLSGAVPAGKDWRYWAAEARSAAQRGDFRAAIHAAYWTAMAQLEENRQLPEDRSRTPRESLRLLRRENAAYTPLSQLTRRFELTWYGYKSATSADWDDVMKQLEAIECLRSSTRAIASS
jgi:hypothetical protein